MLIRFEERIAIKIKGKILSFLGLLSISFSALALTTECPPPEFFNYLLPLEGREVRVFIPGLGLGYLFIIEEPFTRALGKWEQTNIYGGQVLCSYQPTQRFTIGAFFKTDSSGWKPDPNGLLSNKNECSGRRTECKVTNT